MLKIQTDAILSEINANRGIYMAALLVIGLGIATGLAAPAVLPADMAYYTDRADYGAQFIRALLINSGLLLTEAVCGLHPLLLPLLAILLYERAAAIGFTVAVLIRSFSLRGIIAALLAVAPQNIMLLPAMLLMVRCAVSQARFRRRGSFVWRSPSRDFFFSVAPQLIFFFCSVVLAAIWQGFPATLLIDLLLRSGK